MTNYRSRNFYFSTPYVVKAEDFQSVSLVIVSKSQWDSFHSLDMPAQEAYAANSLVKKLHLVEAEEGIFQSSANVSCNELRDKLTKQGMKHNPDLDYRLKEWVEKYEREIII